MTISREQYELEENEENDKKRKMFSLGDIIKRNFTIGKQKEFQALAEEINKEFPEITFMAVCGMCKKIGTRAVREIFIEVCKSECKDKVKLFLWKIGENFREIKFKEVK